MAVFLFFCGFFCLFVFFVKSQDTGNATQHFLLHFTFKTFVLIDWVSLISAHMSLKCRLKRLTHRECLFLDTCCFSVASKPPQLDLLRTYSLLKNLLPISGWALYFGEEAWNPGDLIFKYKVDKVNSILIIEKGIVFYHFKHILESDIFENVAIAL